MSIAILSLDSSLVVLLFCVRFFMLGARMEHRSPWVWGGASLGSWILVTQYFVGGLYGGLLSQALVFAGLTGWAFLRERGAPKREA